MGSNRVFRGLARAAASAGLIMFTSICAKPASAQGVYASVANDIIQARLGESGTENNGAVTGRFAVDDLRATAAYNVGLQTIMFGPTVDLVGVSGSINIPGSFVTIRIDGGAAAGGKDLVFGDTTTGFWLNPPTNLNGKILASWATATPPIQVDCEVTLVHDLAAYKFTVFNGIQSTAPPTPGSAAHSIGLRFAQNYNVPSAGFTNEGPVFLSNGGQICTETVLVGSQVPADWKVFDSTAANPIGGILIPPGADSSFIPPDQFIVALGLTNELWDHTPNTLPGINFCTDTWDSSVALFYNPRVLPIGSTFTYTTYFGRRASTIDFGKPMVAGIDAIGTLSLNNGAPTPNPFTVTGFVINQAAFPLSGANATISLPTGLALAAGETTTKTNGSVAAGAESRFIWHVVPTGAASGRLTYSVSFAAGPGSLGKSVTRTVDIPALPTQVFPTGLQMVSFPDNFSDGTPSIALGLDPIDFALLRWNPTIGVYEAVSRIAAGEGYWLNLASSKTITLVGASPVAVDASAFQLKLTKGWNQIGNPFLRIVNWADVQVLDTSTKDLTPLSVDQAAAAGLIQSALFRYDPQTQSYLFDQTSNTDFTPYVGYWVESLKDGIILLVTPPPISRAVRPADSRAASTVPGGWKLGIIASSNGVTDSSNVIGLSTKAADGVDHSDIEKPPAVQQKLSVGLMRAAGSGRSAMLAQDIQLMSGSRKTWTLNVTTPKPKQDVTLSWPSISTLPRNYELFITDSSTGQRTQMRQSPTIHVNLGEATTRSFVITAEPRTGAAVFNLNVLAVPSRGGGSTAIEVRSTQSASIVVRIKTANGHTLRTLSGRSAALGSSATFVWDNRDAKGVAVPSGSYLIEAAGTTADGATSRMPTPITIVR